jgi:hypothetical protein
MHGHWRSQDARATRRSGRTGARVLSETYGRQTRPVDPERLENLHFGRLVASLVFTDFPERAVDEPSVYSCASFRTKKESYSPVETCLVHKARTAQHCGLGKAHRRVCHSWPFTFRRSGLGSPDAMVRRKVETRNRKKEHSRGTALRPWRQTPLLACQWKRGTRKRQDATRVDTACHKLCIHVLHDQLAALRARVRDMLGRCVRTPVSTV